MRLGKQREAGKSFTELEKSLGLRPCSGMTAFRCFKFYEKIVRKAKKTIKPALEKIAGPGRIVMGDEPPTDEFEQQLKKDIERGEQLETALATIKSQYRERWNRAIEKATEVVRSEMEE
jgi:hypothetical protein